MEQILDLISWFLILTGSAFVVIGTLGILRFPDVYSRMHAAGITDTAGAFALLIGMMIQAGIGLVSVKLFFILIFLFFTSPVSTHAVARAAENGGLRPLLDDELKKRKAEREEKEDQA